MEPAMLEALTLRAIELTVAGRSDPRLLVSRRRNVPGPRRMARELAGLANAAGDRTPLLLMGIHGDDVTGLDDDDWRQADDDYWHRVTRAYPADPPTWTTETVTVSDTRVLAVHVEPARHLIPAWRAARVEVPWFDGADLVQAPAPKRIEPAHTGDPLSSLDVLRVWIERRPDPDRRGVTTLRGIVELDLRAAGFLADDRCAATLMLPDEELPITLDTRIHPTSAEPAVERVGGGVEIRSTSRASLYVAAARSERPPCTAAATAELVVSIVLPGRNIPELRSLRLVLVTDDPPRWELHRRI
jgi:hypothetical protein